MLGYRRQDNDIFIYFEDDELDTVKSRKVRGVFVNTDTPVWKPGQLEVKVADIFGEHIIIRAKTDVDGYITQMNATIRNQGVFPKLLMNGSYESHEGFRHINLIDVKRADALTLIPYELLKNFVYGK